MNQILPEKMLRGIPLNNTEFITVEGYPTKSVFRFGNYDEKERNEDGFCELSINWFDDDGAVKTLLNQINERKGTPQFQGGYCELKRSQINSLAFFTNKIINYERKIIENNKYHGNILMKNDISKSLKDIISFTLAGLAGTVIKREE